MRLVDSDELKKSLNYIYDCAYIESKSKEGIASDIIEEIDNAPTIKTFTLLDIEEQYRKGLEKGLSEWETERPQGEWIFRSGVTCGGYYKCNKCGEVERAEKNFCPNCGADMRGEEE